MPPDTVSLPAPLTPTVVVPRKVPMPPDCVHVPDDPTVLPSDTLLCRVNAPPETDTVPVPPLFPKNSSAVSHEPPETDIIPTPVA